MESVNDPHLLIELHSSGQTLLFAEQNNGYIWRSFLKVMFLNGASIDPNRIYTANTLGRDGSAHFIHSATYEELIDVYGLSAKALEARCRSILEQHR